MDSIIFSVSIIPETLMEQFFIFLSLSGYLLIVTSLILDPIEKKPTTYSLEEALGVSRAPLQNGSKSPAYAGFFGGIGMSVVSVLSFLTGGLYWYRATTGLERHLRPVAIAFFLIGISDLFLVPTRMQSSTNVDVFRFLDTFGPVWILSHIVFFVGVILLCRWVFGYLLKRFETQLFMLFTILTVVVFLLTSITFTGLLVGSLKKENLTQLETNARVLAFTIESKKQETASNVAMVSSDQRVVDALVAKDRRLLADLLSQYVRNKQQDHLVVVNATSQVVALGEDTERFGASFSENPLVKKALAGTPVGSIVTEEGVVVPEIRVDAAAPIQKDGVIIGAAVMGSTLDNAFLDGVKKATGLDGMLFSMNTVSSTTILAPDGLTRPIGTLNQNKKIINQVLLAGRNYTGSDSILNRQYFTAYIPLTNMDSIVVGMLAIARPQSTVLIAAGKAIELTFLVTIALIIISIIPSYLIARFLTKQL